MNGTASSLEQELAKLQTILSSLGDGVFAVDNQCRITLMNAVAERLSGYTAAEAIGKPYTDIFKFSYEDHPTAKYADYIELVLKTGQVRNLAEHTVLTQKNGKTIPVADSCAPIRDEEKNIIGCVIIFRDASRERQLEKSRVNFFSIASHQLRTPLGNMRWNVEMLLNGDCGTLPIEAIKVIEQIRDSNHWMILLVNDLLDVTRIDQQLVHNQPTETEVSSIIETVISQMQATAKQKNVKVTLEATTKPLPKVVVDPTLFHEVIGNLLSNAIKYGPDNHSVTVSVSHNASSNMVKIDVADDGMGIPKKDQAQLFSRFFRAENALESEAEGTGLGLFVVKSYVESWGGQVSFKSPTLPDDRGSLFTVLLPTIKV